MEYGINIRDVVLDMDYCALLERIIDDYKELRKMKNINARVLLVSVFIVFGVGLITGNVVWVNTHNVGVTVFVTCMALLLFSAVCLSLCWIDRDLPERFNKMPQDECSLLIDYINSEIGAIEKYICDMCQDDCCKILKHMCSTYCLPISDSWELAMQYFESDYITVYCSYEVECKTSSGCLHIDGGYLSKYPINGELQVVIKNDGITINTCTV